MGPITTALERIFVMLQETNPGTSTGRLNQDMHGQNVESHFCVKFSSPIHIQGLTLLHIEHSISRGTLTSYLYLTHPRAQEQ